MSDEPKWTSSDPQNWSTNWQAWYQIGNARPVMVDGYQRSEPAASTLAEKSLLEALEKVKELGLQVEGKCWTVKHRSRTQYQKWPEANVTEFCTAMWSGSLTVVMTSLLRKDKP